MASTQLRAWHIVGGEIELLHIENFRYSLNLILYFDRAQTQNPNPEDAVTLYIYSNRDNSLVDSVVISGWQGETVEYTQEECADRSNIKTDRIIYSQEIELSESIYNSPEGYYVVWERCCRNAGVVNIVNPSNSGMTLTLDFPPVVRNGERFINSSPSLLKPLSDFGCMWLQYYADFKATDFDGDSLVYTLVAPLNSSSVEPVPTPSPKPHDPITFVNSIGVNNMVPGDPPLGIDPDGFLRVVPNTRGLFLFALRIDEYRDGELIGSMRREFQLSVQDESSGCSPPVPLVAALQLPDDDELYYDYAEVFFEEEDENCIRAFVGNFSSTNKISVRFNPLNFDEDFPGFSFVEEPINSSQDTTSVKICLPKCEKLEGEPFLLDVIIVEEACPLEQTDTIRLSVDLEVPPNSQVQFATERNLSYVINEDENLEISLHGIDMDPDDTLCMELYSPFFPPASHGMRLDSISVTPNDANYNFVWDADCQEYEFAHEEEFRLAVVLDDKEVCDRPGDTTWIDLKILLPDNTDPFISFGDISPVDGEVELDVLLGDELNYQISTLDEDGDTVNLRLVNASVSEVFGYNFTDTSGTTQATSNFVWSLTCDEVPIRTDGSYFFTFITDDIDRCQETNFDTLNLKVNVKIPENTAPILESAETFNMYVDETTEFTIPAFDDDNDFITIERIIGFNNIPSNIFEFSRGEGQGEASARITWNPSCDNLGSNYESVDYKLELVAYDDRCPINSFSDTISYTFTINNLEVDFSKFNPPNAFSPNGDGINDRFGLSNNSTEEYNLPDDNCFDQFQYVRVIDRNGTEVFYSDSRDFQWDGGNLEAGTYFYYVKYVNSEYKGVLNLVY